MGEEASGEQPQCVQGLEVGERVASRAGEGVKTLSLSAGYALVCDHDSLTAEALVRESDTAMYEAKAAYYREAGRDRRRRRPRKD